MKKPASFLMHKPQLIELGCGKIFKRMGTINSFGVEFDAGGKIVLTSTPSKNFDLKENFDAP